MINRKSIITKVPGSGIIETFNPDDPERRTHRIILPERPPISDILKSPKSEKELIPNIKIDTLKKMIDKNIKPPEDSNEFLLPEANSAKMQKFKELDDTRNQIMKRQKIIDDMADYAARHHPGIAEDLKNHTMNYYQDYLNMFPEHEKLDRELGELERKYMEDPYHDEHFEGVLNKIRGKK